VVVRRRQTRLWWIAIAVSLVAFTGYCTLRPVCVPLSPDTLTQFNVPIDQRTDRDLYFPVFQLREGQWHQCKTWLSRQFFF
jgi:hypothetical protein